MNDLITVISFQNKAREEENLRNLLSFCLDTADHKMSRLVRGEQVPPKEQDNAGVPVFLQHRPHFLH